MNEKISATDKNNVTDGGQDNDGEEEDQCAAEEDCRVKETTDELIEWIACNSCESWWHTCCTDVNNDPALFLCQDMNIKGATKLLHVAHYSCVVIILFNTGLYKSAFSTDSFGKLVFCFSAPFCVMSIRCNLHKLYNICIITVYIVGGCHVL